MRAPWKLTPVEEPNLQQLREERLLADLDQLADLLGLHTQSVGGVWWADAQGERLDERGVTTLMDGTGRLRPLARPLLADCTARRTCSVVSLTPVTHSMVMTRRVVSSISGWGMMTSGLANSLQQEGTHGAGGCDVLKGAVTGRG